MKRSDDFIDSFGLDLAEVSKQEAARIKIKKEMTVPELRDIGQEAVDKTAVKNALKLINKPGREAATGVIAFTEGEGGFAKHLARVRELAAEPAKDIKHKLARLAVGYTNRSKDFQKIDQMNKFADFSRMVRDGIPEKELLKITNNTMATNARLFPEDIVGATWKNGEKYFTIKPDKAMEIVNDIYMNYAAMPAFIRTLRTLPVVGSPFYAFSWAMMTKTGKTVLNNPAAFNKINFFLQELESDKSPLEREALKSKYYSYLDKPGMINLGDNIPFFKGHPIYVNLAQMVPYYSLQIFNPSQRGFNDDIRGQFATAIDKSPLFKDPVGQMLMDYVVLPAIIQDQTPVNMFGTPLYEKDASLAAKMAYAMRTLGEAVTPSLPSAVATTMLPLTDEQMKWFPSYQGRKTGYAVRGKTAVGVIGNEDAASRGMRAWLSIAGVNLYPVDLVNISNEIKKRVK
jgi:hypothetical protein